MTDAKEVGVIKLLKFLLLLLVAAFGAGFAYINPDLVGISYYFGRLELPLGVLILLAIGVGLLAGMLASVGGLIRLKRENAHSRRLAELANREIEDLRATSLQDR